MHFFGQLFTPVCHLPLLVSIPLCTYEQTCAFEKIFALKYLKYDNDYVCANKYISYYHTYVVTCMCKYYRNCLLQSRFIVHFHSSAVDAFYKAVWCVAKCSSSICLYKMTMQEIHVLIFLQLDLMLKGTLLFF